MRARAFLVLMVALVAIAGLAASASAGSGTDRATGGGQVLFSDQGPGNTIAFTSQGDSSSARGQVQVIDRQGSEKFHGIVDCMDVNGNAAAIYGHDRDGTGTFELYVVDNGEGMAAGNDIVALTRNPSSNCSNPDDDFDSSDALARGNAQVYDAP